MAMTPNGLKAVIIAEMSAQGFNITNPQTGGEGEKYVEALATAIVNYIQASAEVPVTSGSSSGTYKVT